MNKQKTLLVLAAGSLQLAAIETAKRIGVRVVAADGSPSAPGLALADVAEVANITDIATCVDLAKKYRIDGVIHICSEVSMLAVGAINDALGLKGPSFDVAKRSTNKALMRAAFERAGAPSPKSLHFSAWSEVCQNFSQFPDRTIYKPSRSSASRGVSVLSASDSLESHRTAFEYAVAESRDREAVVEEFMEGPEFSVETLVWNGVPRVLTITDKITSGVPHFVELGHTQPTRFSPEDAGKIESAAVQGVKALGLDWSAAHAEIKLTSNGAKIVEIGPRLGGDFITTDLVGLSTGIDMVEAAIRLALGEVPDLTPRSPRRGAAIRFLPPPKETIRQIEGLEKARLMPGVLRCVVDLKTGDVAQELKSSLDRGGYVIAVGNDANEAAYNAENALKTIVIR